jgi:hypothetical protein
MTTTTTTITKAKYKHNLLGVALFAGTALALFACKEDEGASAKSDTTRATPTSASPPSTGAIGQGTGAASPSPSSAWATGARGATPTGPVPAMPAPTAAGAATGYALDAIKTIADNCSSAKVILTTAPANADNRYPWTYTRQAMLANQQFKVVSGPPSAPGQVQFLQFEAGQKGADGKWPQRTLIAFCADGGTCNQLAAMYKAIVRSSSPQPVCGNLPGTFGASSPVSIQQGDPKADLPDTNDTIGLCARLSACMIATDRATPGDPGLECQKAPSSFKTACARKYPCAEVLACTKQ